MKIAVIGAGITGLACARQLEKLARGRQLPVEILLFEKSRRMGGLIETIQKRGALLECGPDSLFTEEDWISAYLKGLDLEIIATNLDRRESFILIGRDFISMSEGLKTMTMADILPFVWNLKSAEDFKGVRYSHFVSFKGGMEALINRMFASLSSVTVKLECGVDMIAREGQGFRIFSSQGEDWVDALCLALPTQAGAGLLRTVNTSLSKVLAAIPVRACATVNLIYSSSSLGRQPQGFGFIVPETEKRLISGATFSSLEFSGRSRTGECVIRVFLSERSFPNLPRSTPEEILRTARMEIEDILDIQSNPVDHSVRIFADSLPDYQENHEELVRSVEGKVREIDGLALGGNWLNGAGIPRCIQAGEAAAEKLMDYLGRKIPKQEV